MIASDIDIDLMQGIAADNLKVRRFDVVKDEPPDAPYDRIAMRALLHRLPERRTVVSRLVKCFETRRLGHARGTRLLSHLDGRAADPASVLERFVDWAAAHQIDYYVGRKVATWLAHVGMADVSAQGHTIVHNGGSEFAQWWISSIAEMAGDLQKEAGVSSVVLEEFYNPVSRSPLSDDEHRLHIQDLTASMCRSGVLAKMRPSLQRPVPPAGEASA